ncbi:MAG: hypothetical protein NVS9B14_06650 [Candidatus Acidiferrum sp.]
MDGLSFIDEELRRRGIDPAAAAEVVRGSGTGMDPNSLEYKLRVGATSQPNLEKVKQEGRERMAPQGPAVTAGGPGGLSFANAQPAQPAAAQKKPGLLSFAERFPLTRKVEEAVQGAPNPGDYRLKPGEGPQGWKKWLDIAGQILSPRIEQAIPGSRGNLERQKAQQFADAKAKSDAAVAGVKEEASVADTESQTAERNARAAEYQKKADEQPDDPADKKIDEGYNAKGERVLTFQKPTGETYTKPFPDIVRPPEKPVADANKLAGEIEAQVGPKPTGSVFQGKNYGTPEAAQRAWGRAAEQIKNREAAAGADARGKAYGANRPINVLDTWNGNRPVVVSAREAEENPQRYVTQNTGVKAVAGQVTIDDIEGALNNLKATTKVLDGGSTNRAAIAAVLADPKTTTANFLQSEVAGTLNADEQDYVIAVLTAREVVPGIRNLLGTGTATDTRVKNMLDTLPGAKTPSSEFANKQIDSALATLKRVKPAVPNVRAQGAGADKPAQPGALPPGWK